MKSVYRFTPEFILVIYVLAFFFFKNPSNNWDRVINSDGKGYYAYLTTLFIYHDLNYRFVEYYEDKYYPSDRSVFKEFRMNIDGHIVNKCNPGLAIPWLPFFLGAHLFCHFTGFQPDGYSLPYQYAIALAALFYLWLGCWCLYRLLLKSGASMKRSAFIVLLIALATNLPFYVIKEGSMTHAYSFALITCFFLSLFNFVTTGKGKWLILTTFLFAVIVLIRPTNGLILLLVPFFTSYRQKSQFHFPLKAALTGILIMIVLFSIPPVIWLIQTGKPFVYSYGNESFNFFKPHVLSILFSYNRGWFVYTPVAFISMFGFIGLFRENRLRFAWLFLYFALFIYGSSCWWIWYYASKCGQRIFIDSYALIAILLMYLFISIERTRLIKFAITTLLVFLVLLNMVQFYQHIKWIFPPYNITKEIYWDSFFTFQPLAKIEIPGEAVIKQKTMFNDMEKDLAWMNEGTIKRTSALSGIKASVITPSDPYSIGINASADSLFITANRIIRVAAWIYTAAEKSEASLVVDFEKNGKSFSYNAFYIGDYVRPEKWTRVECAFYVPRNLPADSDLKLYFFAPRNSLSLSIDDMQVDFLSLKDDLEYQKLEGVLLPVLK